MSNSVLVKYGLVLKGRVESVFYSDKPKSAYPDVEEYLMEVPEEVQCNWTYENGVFIPNTIVVEESES